MHLLLIIYIPIILSILWAVRRTYLQSNMVNALLLLGCGGIVVTNSLIKHVGYDGYEIPESLNALQQILSSLIVPLSYIFFARQIGRRWNNETSISLLMLIAFLLLPNIVIVADGANLTDAASLSLGFRSFCYIGKDGQHYEYTISDFVIVLQAVVTLIRVIPVYHKIHRYGLELSRDVKLFMGWWLLTVAFIIFSSINGEQGKAEPLMNATCHIMFMFVVTSIFILLGKGFDLRPVVVSKEEGIKEKEPVELDTFTNQSKEMAEKLRKLINERHIYRECGYSKEKAITELATNRTYFAKMMKAEFGCSFSDLLNNKRIEFAKYLLNSTDYNLTVISEMCGFNDSSYLVKVFKQKTGHTPGEWRESIKGKSIIHQDG